MSTPTESHQLNRLVQRCGGTEDGAKWLKLAVDPFHDVDLELVGFPDQTPGRSVVYNVTKNITISRPEGHDGKFDAHVAFLPTLHTTEWEAHDVFTNSGVTLMLEKTPRSDVSTNKMQPGIIKVCTVPNGTPTFRSGGDEVHQSIDYGSLIDVDGSSMSRLIGCAFEVHNTTESLHKSGAVTTYRYDTNKDIESLRLYGTYNSTARVSNDLASNGIHGPPTTESEAKLQNGITWEAAEGCLVPCVMDTINEPQKLVPRRTHCIVSSEGAAPIYWTPKNIDNTTAMFDFNGTGFIWPEHNAPSDLQVSPSMILPFMGSGAYFTGLSSQTTLTVTMRAFVEVFPNPGNDLVPLAHPSSPYDGRVLQCYSEIMSELHSGYPVRDNAAGDYFRKALSALKQAVHVGQMIPMTAPMASAVSAGIQAGEDIAKTMGGKKKAKKKGNGGK